MFKRMLSAFGVGGPSVDTVLDAPHAGPGQLITGEVRIQGGSADVEIGQVVLALATRMEVEHHGEGESAGTGEFLRSVIMESVQVPAGQRVDVPFQLLLPWETPISMVGGAQLPGMVIGLRTELVIAGAPDKGDLDRVDIHPLPSQNRVLDAFGELGFRFRSADVEVGRLHGVPQELGFYQEIEFLPPPQVLGRVNQVELTFVATSHELYVVLEAGKRGGMFSAGGDSFGHFAMTHEEAEATDWAEVIGQWLAQVAERGPGANAAFGGHSAYGRHGHDEHHHRRGPGMGAVVGGVAAGVAGGLIVGEVFDEITEEDEEVEADEE